MAKVRLQYKPSESQKILMSDEERRELIYRGPMDVLQRAYAIDGLSGLYRGMQTQISKAVFCQAILSMSKEQVSYLKCCDLLLSLTN